MKDNSLYAEKQEN